MTMTLQALHVRKIETQNNRGVELLVIAVVILSLATLAVALRFVSRRIKRVRWAADDYMIIVALLGAYGNGFAEIVGVSIGVIGPHQSTLSIDQIKAAVKCLVAAEVSWTVSIWALKISLLLFFLRIFIQKSFRIAAHILMAIVTLFCIASILTYLVSCRPLTAARCGHQYPAWYSTAAFNLATDLTILSLPMPSVWHLQLPRVTKCAITGIFSIGFLVCIISVLRITSIRAISPEDLTYTSVNTDIYSVLEPSLGITSACLAIMRPLFDKIVPARFIRSKLSAKNGSNKGISHFSGLPAKFIRRGKESSDFQRLKEHGAYLLERVGEGKSQKTLTSEEDRGTPGGGTYTAEIKGDAAAQVSDLEQARPGSRINVTREWTVG